MITPLIVTMFTLTSHQMYYQSSPSPEDKRVTEQLYQASKLLDINLLDHIILGQGRFLSMREIGAGFP